MVMMRFLQRLLLLLALMVPFLSSRAGAADSSVYIVHGIPGVAVDVYVGTTDGDPAIADFQYGNSVGPLAIPAGPLPVFVVLGGVLHTPTLDTGCLAGITRELVLEWAPSVVETREEDHPLDVLRKADEVFITSSTRGVHPVSRVDDRGLLIGEVTAAVLETYLIRSAADLDP